MEVRLDGRVALVTGGSRGMGRAMAEKFAAAGADLVLTARRASILDEASSELATATGREVISCPGDMSQENDIVNVFEAAKTKFGRIDILVNNAGSALDGPFEEMTDAQWQSDLDLKLFGAVRMSRLVLPGMKQNKWGRIINVIAVGAKTPSGGGAPSQVSRAAGLALTKGLAGEFAPYNILVNALCTGSIVTDQIVREQAEEAPDIALEELIGNVGRNIPLGRMGTADEFAKIACFLVSDCASYITGTAINVDGGLSPVV